jgi:hypothetical protein
MLVREQAHHRQRPHRGGTWSFHGGRLDLHLSEVDVEDVEDVEEVEEHLGPATVPGASETSPELSMIP